MEYRCVKCGFRIKTLFVQYSPGNIRLMKCENCRAVADEYIECEIMILLIDLILHKPQAYRHLLYNVLNSETVNLKGILWKSTVGFLLLDAYRNLLLKRSNEGQCSSMSFSLLAWICRMMLKDVILGNIMFLGVFFHASKILLNTSAGASRFKDFLLAVLISSYFKIFLVAMMVWNFPSSVIYIIDLFVLSSNTVALKAPLARLVYTNMGYAMGMEYITEDNLMELSIGLIRESQMGIKHLNVSSMKLSNLCRQTPCAAMLQ